MNSKEDILKIVGNETFLFANNKDKIMILKNVKVEPCFFIYNSQKYRPIVYNKITNKKCNQCDQIITKYDY